MLPISTKEIIRFVPESCREQEKPPTYLIAVPAEWAKQELRRQLILAGAVKPSREHLNAALIEGIREVAPAEKQDEQIALVKQLAGYEDESKVPEGLARQIMDIEERVAVLYPPYAALCDAKRRHDDNLPILAARMFLKGAENVDVKFEMTNGRVSDDTLAALDISHLQRVGYEAIALMYVSEEQEKNSESPSRSPSAPATSAEGASHPTPPSSGGSGTKPTKKTPASS